MIKKKYLLIAFVIAVIITTFKMVRIEKLNQEALDLTLEDVPSWLKKYKVSVPEDLAIHIGLHAFILDVLRNAEDGIDASLGSNHVNTIQFIHAIQKAAGYTFE